MSFQVFLKERLGPFRHRDFRIFYAAQVTSMVGSWMQDLAKTWIILNLIGKSSAIGTLMVASAIPHLLLGTYGGVLADRRPIRPILLGTQVVLGTLAFALGLIVSTGSVEFWHLILFALLEGTLLAFDMPAFNKLTPALVPPEDFRQAMALNSVAFHLARVLGPSLAGVAMGLWGTTSVFWINAISFLGVVIVVARLRSVRLEGVARLPPSPDTQGMRVAWNYLWRHKLLWRVMVQFFLVLGLVFPLIFTTFRVFLQNKFQLSAQDFGFVFAVPGVGSLLGSLAFLLFAPADPLKVLPVGVIGVSLFLVGIAEAQTLALTLMFLGCFSFCMFLCLSSLTLTIHLRIENQMRGRVSAIIGMCFVSLSPLMAGPVGVLSDLIGERNLMIGLAGVFFVTSAFLAWSDRRPRENLRSPS